ncbi:MAG: hypothetical protein LBO04_03530 [Spirochaetaceae bacterium]|nr:hypothetical protein [Spirochaetaceae bacterium]
MCGSAPKVSRGEGQADLSLYRDDNDVRPVCDKLVASCLASGNVDNFVSQYEQRHGERDS